MSRSPTEMGVRAYTETPGAVPLGSKPTAKGNDQASVWALVFDCETSIDAAQRLRVGFFQVRCKGILKREGLFFHPENLMAEDIAFIRGYPEHRPYPKQAIAASIADVSEGDPANFFDMANRFRNCLMHGDAIESIEAELGVDFGHMVDQLGQAAWAILMKKLTSLGAAQLKGKSLSATNKHVPASVGNVFYAGHFSRG